MDEVFYAGESPPHVTKSPAVDMMEASQVPLPFDEDDDMVPAVDEVSILYNFVLL